MQTCGKGGQKGPGARFGENLGVEQWLSLLDILRLWRLFEPASPIVVSATPSTRALGLGGGILEYGLSGSPLSGSC